MTVDTVTTKVVGFDGGEPKPPPKPIKAEPPKETSKAFEETPVEEVGAPAILEEVGGIARLSLPVPCNVYGGAAMAALIHDVETFHDWWERCGEAYIRLVLSHTMQGLLLLGLAQLNSWQVIAIDSAPGKQCYTLDWWFFLPCVWVFIATVMAEIIDASDMCELILVRVPTVEGKSVTFKYRADEEGNLELVGGGMSYFRKVFITVVILVPRFLLAIGMLTIGGWFLITSGSNTNLLMNCLAANFILDTDELIFEFLTPAKTKRLIEAIPPFETDHVSWTRHMMKRWSFHVKLVASFATTLVMYLLMPACDMDPCTGASELNIKCPII